MPRFPGTRGWMMNVMGFYPAKDQPHEKMGSPATKENMIGSRRIGSSNMCSNDQLMGHSDPRAVGDCSLTEALHIWKRRIFSSWETSNVTGKLLNFETEGCML